MEYALLEPKTTNFFECRRIHNISCGLHMHRHAELLYVEQGEYHIYFNKNDPPYILKENDLFLILPNQIHSYYSPGESFVYTCIFSTNFAPTFFKEIQGLHIEPKAFLVKESILNFAKSEFFLHDLVPDAYIIKSALYAILNEYKKTMRVLSSSHKDLLLIEKIIAYVNANYTEKISLKTIANELGYEYHYLSKYFHECIPMNFAEYVNWYRVNLATELLQTTNMTITEVATQSGFQSLRNFNHIFFKYMGVTPSNISAKEETSTTPC